MPALTVTDTTTLPRIPVPPPQARIRAVDLITTAVEGVEGGGFPVRRGFTGIPVVRTDPFILLDQAGPTLWGPGETKGAPWHPHRGFETVTYLIDGEISHRDSFGGGGVIQEGDTQWMTAGAGVLHDELPTEETFQAGGWTHGIQLWVNLPARLKWTAPRYQTVDKERYVLLASRDAGALVRLIAGDIAGQHGPGNTHTPITLAHVTLQPDAEITLEWPADHSALAYVLDGAITAGPAAAPAAAQQTVVFGPGDAVSMRAAGTVGRPAEVMLLGGQPLREPVAHAGPFVMNTEQELREAFDDFRAGRLGRVPRADGPRRTTRTTDSPG